jgi:hypothetical protein
LGQSDHAPLGQRVKQAHFYPFTPANAGVQMEFSPAGVEFWIWIPAFAGMNG